MTEVPKIVHQRLRAAEVVQQGHPEADVLAAFAEQALAQTEREIILEHLARCAECREVVALAIPATEVIEAAVRAEGTTGGVRDLREPVLVQVRSNWFAWANLRWAALAAGVVVAVLAIRPMLEHRGGQNAVETAGSPTQASPVQPATGAMQAPAPPTQVTSQLSAHDEGMPRDKTAKPEVLTHNFTSALTPNAMAAKPVAPGPASSHAMGAGTMRRAPVPSAGAASTIEQKSSAETSEASGAMTDATKPSTEIAEAGTLSSEGSLMSGKQAAEIVKAKPPLEEMASGSPELAEKKELAGVSVPAVAQGNRIMPAMRAAPAYVPATMLRPPSWMIAEGLLKRSVDGGRHWQTILEAEHPVLCYASRSAEVWAGGEAGMVQHSTDSGATWNVIAVSVQGQRLGSDVVHIELQDPAGVVLTTSNHESWVSGDGGKSWEKK